MKQIFSLLLALIFLASCQQEINQKENTQEQSKVTARDGVFIHISHGMDDPHRVVMALQMAVMMSENKDVAVYFDIKGIEVVLKDAENIEYLTFAGSLEQIEKLKGKGVLLMACPGCLKAAGKTGDDVMDGVMVAEKEKFFNFTKGRILTLDY
ncbi:MAG: DsrE family protein [Bacteroidales bacterium]|nr:DsrE family protein [Bacteroidales bacterium]